MKKIVLLFLMLCLIGCQNEIISENTLSYLISLENNTALLAPEGYEKDLHDVYKDQFVELKLSEDVKFYDKNIYTVIDEQGKEDRNERTKEISIKEIEEAIEYYSAYVYLECDKQQITKMTLYGELIVEK